MTQWVGGKALLKIYLINKGVVMGVVVGMASVFGNIEKVLKKGNNYLTYCGLSRPYSELVVGFLQGRTKLITSSES